MSYDFSFPTWKQIKDMKKDFETLQDRYTSKATQVTELRNLIWDLRTKFEYPDEDKTDTNPCWCHSTDEDGSLFYPNLHLPECVQARSATEMLWRK